jgi:protein-disulfide isomerase
MGKQATLQRRASQAARARLERQRRQRRRWVFASAAVALMLVIFAVYAIDRVRQSDDSYPVPASVSEDGAGIVLGTGPVTVELYSDFLCPACRAFDGDAADDVDQLLAAGKIRLIYRPVAILDRMSTNQYSTRSAAGAGCAADAGKLLDYSKVLFANQPAEGGAGHSDEELIQLAGTAGITSPDFGQCLRSGRYADWVEHVTSTMEPNQVTGTPTVVVAGKPLSRPTGERLVAAVDAASTE